MTFVLFARRLMALAGVGGAIALSYAGCSTTPTFVPDDEIAAGNSASGSGGGSSGSSGSSGSCVTADDCTGDENECAHRICSAGKCGHDFSPSGFLAGAQTMGDCEKTVCDGAGAVKTVADDSDIPSDGNACTVDVCTGGKPSHPPSSVGTVCGATQSLACDGAGNCAGCKADADCGVSTACAMYSCDLASTTCKITYVASGMGDPGSQQAGDCKKNVCNGSGGTELVDDNTDLPNDGNACTTDTCSMGTPSHSPAASGTSCGGTFKCDATGSCAGCVTDADCGQNNACASFACTAGACKSTYIASGQGDPGGQVTGDCKKNVCNGSGSPTNIADDTDLPNDGNPCTNDTCANGVPGNTPVASGATCGTNLKCDGAGNCKGCLTNTDCGQSTSCISKVCQAGQCATENVQSGTACGGSNICDGSGNCVCTDPGACTGKCGSLTNACSAPVSCPNCSAPNSCGGGGTANVCGCTDPNACSGKCGTVTNACGVAVACPTQCTAPQSCGGDGVANVCGCKPAACPAGDNCGTLPDGCGGTATCGAACVAPQTCGGSGTANVCGCTPIANPCGLKQCGGTASNGCGGTVMCMASCDDLCPCGGNCNGTTCICTIVKLCP